MSTQQGEAPRPVLTFDEACDRLQVSRSTMFRLIDKKGGPPQLPSFKIGRSTRFLVDDVDAFIRERYEASAR